MLRRSAALLLCLAVGAGLMTEAGGPATAEATRTPPNILLVMTDDQAYETLRKMPNVMELAADGTRYTNYHANFALCCPSRATTLTGQYAHNHHVWTNLEGYPTLAPTAHNTLPSWLQDAGYRTMLIGKFLNRYSANRHGVPPGWDRWRVSTHDGNARNYQTAKLLHEDGEIRTHFGYKTDIYGRMAVDLIEETPHDQPFFMWLAFNAPHAGPPDHSDDPWDALVETASPARRHRNLFKGTKAPSWKTPLFNERDVSDKPRHIRRLEPMTRAMQSAVHEAYSQQLETLQAVDEWVGRLRSSLAASGRLGNTLIVFTTDNGYFFGEHRIREGKKLPYAAASRMPLVVSGPGFSPGAVVSDPRSNVDLAPTILQVARALPGRPLDGVSLTTRVSSTRPLLMEGRVPSGSSGVHYEIRQFSAIRTRRWFYARYRYEDGGLGVELYNLRRDPQMLKSLPGHADARRRLRGQMERMAGYRV